MINKSIDLDQKAKECLIRYWKTDSFRSLQLDIIKDIMLKRDCIVLFPTGGGKSLCFQIPAVLSPNLTIVITPLIALMDDQVEGLKKRGISAEAIHSGKGRNDTERILDNCTWGKVKLLYISPERLHNDNFFERLCRITISNIVIDEAHCISQWGFDFRPAYLEIKNRVASFPDATIIALTATATTQVIKDITDYAGLRNPQVYKKSFKRENVALQITKTEKKYDALKNALKKIKNGNTIVYVRSRREVRHLSSLIKEQGLTVDHYHAGLSFDKRAQVLDDFMLGNLQVVCATNAFGMGLDKGDVRMVMHFDIPGTLEEYVQEFGRAGRDGKLSKAMMLINNSDIEYVKQKFIDRFPSFDKCKMLYVQLHKYYQIPIHRGEEFIKEFDLYAITQYSHLSSSEVYHGIKVLEKNGYIDTFEQRKTQTRAAVKCDINDIRKNELSKEQNLVLTALVRLYEGIMESSCEINIQHLAKFCEIKADLIKQALISLSSIAWIDYKENRNGAKILFLKNRLPKDLFHINIRAYQIEQQNANQKLESVLEYIHTKTCRSSFILDYFDENNVEDCKICDNCTHNGENDTNYEKLYQDQKRMEEGLKPEK